MFLTEYDLVYYPDFQDEIVIKIPNTGGTLQLTRQDLLGMLESLDDGKIKLGE